MHTHPFLARLSITMNFLHDYLSKPIPPRVAPALRLVVTPCRRCLSDVRLEEVEIIGSPETKFFPCPPPVGEMPLEEFVVDGQVLEVPVSARVTLTVTCSGCGIVNHRYGWSPAAA
jgi:hypothetical protein